MDRSTEVRGPHDVSPEERHAIEAALPHRAPFLFLDRVLEETETHLVAEWRVPPDADWFRGHYPGEPVLPGALLSEHVFQAGALLVAHRLGGFDPADGIPVLVKIENARFRRVVRPGETVVTKVAITETVGPAWILTGHTTCGEKSALRIGFVLSATGAMRASGV